MARPWALLDVDGVILDWDRAVHRYILNHCDSVMITGVMDEHAYDLSARYGISTEQAHQLVWDFHHHSSFAELECLPGAHAAVHALAQTHRLAAITACGDASATRRLRYDNLSSLFGDCFQAIHCTQTFEQKNQYLAQYPPSAWVEDHFFNAVRGLKYGHQCFLVNAAYNSDQHHSDITRVSSLAQAAQIILGSHNHIPGA
jgi:uncharacterized HAD superfamily protein